MQIHSTTEPAEGVRQPVMGWQLCCVPPGSYESPEELNRAQVTWIDCGTAATAAAALRAANLWSLDAPARRFDADDWWFRARFATPSPLPADTPVVLGFDGLATIAQVWLNGAPLIESDNMFHAHRCRIETRLRDANEILIRCRALDQLLKDKRPRPRWRVPMIEQQQLRWFRTTLLGRTPGWSAPCAPVGPWRPVWLEVQTQVGVSDLTMHARLDDATGRVDIGCRIVSAGAQRVRGVSLVLGRAGELHRAELALDAAAGRYTASLAVAAAAQWFPHTHGEPALYDAHLEIHIEGAAKPRVVPLRRTGFRRLELATAGGDFRLTVNGTPVFCRGACWTPLDAPSLSATRAAVFAALAQVRAAGMNMLRVSGTLIYESDDFLDGCDAHGILLWQDFMFASMDYPQNDAKFEDSVHREAVQQLARLAGRPALAVLCGNSEVEQQAAMWGAEREHWAPPLFHQTLKELAARHCPGVPYWPSSAHGGSIPHQANEGTTSYYGVGAYLRPLEDARRAELRFATECLAFANVPADATLDAVPGIGALRSHHAAWKARSPRDLGAGWDFDDVRDHYLAKLFGVDPLALRYSDHARYLELSRVVSGELMTAAFGEWRRARSTCRGALVWFLRDLAPGASWGVIDALGTPKAAYHYLRRALQPVAVFMSDEGGNGLVLHAVNETAQALAATLTLTCYRDGHIVVNRDSRALTMEPRSTLELSAGAFFPGFVDTAYSYRFGAIPHTLVVARLTLESGDLLGEAFHLIGGFARARESDLGLTARATRRDDGTFALTVHTERFAQSVHVEAEGFVADEDYFHVAPGASRLVMLRPMRPDAGALHGTLLALNALTPIRFSVTA